MKVLPELEIGEVVVEKVIYRDKPNSENGKVYQRVVLSTGLQVFNLQLQEKGKTR